MLCNSNQPVTGTILVADDQASNRELLEELLTAEGFKVVSVSNGAAALEQLSIAPIDLVLLDVMMPHLTGFQACEKIKSNPDTYLIPVILITALSDKQDRIEGIKSGADDFLTRPVDRTELLARVRSLLKLKLRTDELECAESVLFTLARSIEGKDPYTHGHCERLAARAADLGRHLRLDEDSIVALRRGGYLHDLGKIAVPDAILKKGSDLTLQEWAIIKQHPVTGENICKPLKSLRLVLPIIRHHHEHADGSGYPDGMRAGEIPLLPRVLQVVDVYDALRTARPYKPALSHDQAAHTMRQEARQGLWDTELVNEFFSMLVEQRSVA